MLSQLLNQMDEHLSNKPFIRSHWWSRPWVAHMTIQPPLTKALPLWKRSKDELRLLRLFKLSPEELGRRIEHYWKKPRWWRWFASFGMNKKIDVWNYYQRCLAYQKVRRDSSISDKNLIIANEAHPILEDLSLVLHQSNIKFEAYLEKHCRNPRWIEEHFLEEIKHYQQQLGKIFALKLNKYLKCIEVEEGRLVIKQQAEKEYRQAEAFMFNYHQLHFYALRRIQRSEDNKFNREKEKNTDNRVAVYTSPQTVSSSSGSFPRMVVLQNGMGSLDGAKEWIQSQRQRLESLIEEDSPEKVEELLQTSLNEIKNTTEPHLKCCETMISNIEGNYNAYAPFLEHLDHLQNRLKPLLQGGLRLFHPDHTMNLMNSQAMWEMITRYSQSYLEQSRDYLDSLKNYHQRVGEFYNQHLKRQQALQERAELAIRIQELDQSIRELDKKLQEDSAKFWVKMKARWKQDQAKMEARWEQDKAEVEAQWKQDKAEINAKLEQVQANILANILANIKADKNKNFNDPLHHVNHQTTPIADSAEKLIHRPSL